MKLFRQDSNYAVRTLVFIAQQNQSAPVSSTRVSEALGLPRNFLRRIFSKLIRAGILYGTEGARGGVSLRKPPELITVAEIIFILQGDLKVCNVVHGKEICPDQDTCVMRNRIVEIEKILLGEFHKITIASLLEDANSLARIESQDLEH